MRQIIFKALVWKQVVFCKIAETGWFWKRLSRKKVLNNNFSRTCTQMFFGIDVLRNFAFKRKHLCWSLFLTKLQDLGPATLFKRDFNIGFYLWILQNIYKQLFYKTLPVAAFVSLIKDLFIKTMRDGFYYKDL